MSVYERIKPCDMEKPYIFICYSTYDREAVLEDVLELQKRGCNIWLDERNIDKTAASWGDCSFRAIEHPNCALAVFYLSRHSLTSRVCYAEICHTWSQETFAGHSGRVENLVVETERVGSIAGYAYQLSREIMDSALQRMEKQEQIRVIRNFCEVLFPAGNEKVRVRPKNDPDRRRDYYEELMSVFPEETKF